jgi:predicted DNA-binding protein with PD1-like motif
MLLRGRSSGPCPIGPYDGASEAKGDSRVRKTILVCGLTAGLLLGQQTRQELTKATTPADDSKPNSASVPDVYAISGHFERIVVLRFKYQTGLLEGLEKMVREQKIQNAVILAGAGSVRNYHVHSVTNRTFPSKDTFVEDPTAPADLVGMNGYVIDGRVHAHVTLANPDHAFGGHLEPGTNVFTFAIVTLGVFEKGVDLGRIDDKTYR